MKSLFTSPILLIVLFMISCGSENQQQAELDYSAIPIVELTKEFSITASAEYIPVRITRIIVTRNGSFLIAQDLEKSIHQFDSLGNYVAKIAGPGRGPGELSRNANPHFQGNILYMSNNHGLTSEYRKNDAGIYEHIADHGFRLPGRLRGIRSVDGFNEFYVSEDSVNYRFNEVPPQYTTDLIHLVKNRIRFTEYPRKDPLT